ncbi:MAG: DUF4342 domain-containing protein [archaeon]
MVTEEFEISAEQVLSQIRELIREANVRRIVVRHKEDVLLDIPLSAGVVGTLLAPGLAAFAVFAAIATNCKMTVERVE